MFFILIFAINSLIVWAVRPSSIDEYVGTLMILLCVSFTMTIIKTLIFGHAGSTNRPKPPFRA